MNQQLRRGICSAEDEATFKRWRRAMFIFYGVTAIVLFAAWGARQLTNYADTNEAQIVASPLPNTAAGRR